MPCILGVVDVEALANEISVHLVLGENDGLTEPITTLHRVTVCHQRREGHVDRVFVKEQLIVLLHGFGVWNLLGFTPFSSVPLVLLVFTEIVVSHAIANKTHRNGHGQWRNDIALGHGFIKCVGVRGCSIFKTEQGVGVVVDFIFRCRGQTHKQGVKPIKNRPMLLINRPVRFIDYHQIKVAWTEDAFPNQLLSVDEIHRGPIVRDIHLSA